MESAPGQFKTFESTENKFATESFCRLLNTDEAVFESLQSRLAGAEGHGRIWVHPLYTEQYRGVAKYLLRGDDNLAEIQAELRTGFKRSIESTHRNQDSSPLFVYEAANQITATRKTVADWLQAEPESLESTGIIFVPTLQGDPALDNTALHQALSSENPSDQQLKDLIETFLTQRQEFIAMVEQDNTERLEKYPQSKDPYWTANSSEEERNEYADYVLNQARRRNNAFPDQARISKIITAEKTRFELDLYKTLGLRSSIVSGAFMTSKYSDKRNRHELQSCAGGVAQMLRDNGIPTDISRNVWPPKDRLYPELAKKQTGRTGLQSN